MPLDSDTPLNSLGFAKSPAETRVVVAMSGGVDSSVVAAELADGCLVADAAAVDVEARVGDQADDGRAVVVVEDLGARDRGNRGLRDVVDRLEAKGALGG